MAPRSLKDRRDDAERARKREMSRHREAGFDGAVKRAVQYTIMCFEPLMTMPEGEIGGDMVEELADAIAGVMAKYYPMQNKDGA